MSWDLQACASGPTTVISDADLLRRSAIQQAALIQRGEISSRELLTAHLLRVESLNPTLNAVIEVFYEEAMVAAQEADNAVARCDRLGPLHGVPISIKDSIEIAGHACTAGTLGRASFARSREDATLVARLRRAGAIPLARTNLPDLLFAFESDNLLFGRTCNPYDLTRTAGGSSGGEAALIAAYGSPLGLGSDAAGSVRIPAAFCGIAGIKPTSGRLPRTGHFPPAGGWIERLWQIGPMARYVEDLVVAMGGLVGPDGRDASVPDIPFGDPSRVALGNLRVAFYTDNGFVRTQACVSRVIYAAAEALTRDLHVVKEDRPRVLELAFDLEMKLLGADGGDSIWKYLEEVGSQSVHPLLRRWLERLDAYRTDIGGFQAYWSEWDLYQTEMLAFLSNYDVILCPAYTQAALPHGTSQSDENFHGFSHTMAYNLAGWPAAVVRCGESPEGLPIGIQVVARPWREDVALAVAGWLEKEFGGWREPPVSRSRDQA